MEQLKRTPLYDVYSRYGGKTIDFGGWELPVQFSGIKKEHQAVRTRAGLFDVSHMGEIEVKGSDSFSFLQKIMTNDISKIKNGGVQYTAMCYENGGTVDDLLIYKMKEDHYLLIVNASNIEKDYLWLDLHLEGDVILANLAEGMAQLAIQGPKSEIVLQKLISNTNLSKISYFSFQNEVLINGKPVLISRTGYTGEDGFEIYCNAKDAIELWEVILETGKEDGLVPCGLGCRDTLRFEATLALYGQELSEEVTPLEAGIGFVVKLDKESNFIGKDVLKRQKEKGLTRKIVGLEMIDRGIPRHGYKVYSGDLLIGELTSGTHSPSLKKNLGLALLKSEFIKLGGEVEIEIRNKRLRAIIVPTPFYKREKK